MEVIESTAIGNFKYLLPQLIICLICLYYLIKTQSLDGLLLSFGSSFSLIILIYQIFFHPYSQHTSLFFENYVSIESILGILNVMSSITFIAGFLILILKQCRVKTTTIEDDVKEIK